MSGVQVESYDDSEGDDLFEDVGENSSSMRAIEAEELGSSNRNADIMDSAIRNEELANLVKLFDEFTVEGWEHIYKSPDLDLYRLPLAGTDVYKYRSRGIMQASAAKCFMLNLDLLYRKEWDPYCMHLEVVTNEEGHADLEYIHWQVKFPFPMSHRDYAFGRKSGYTKDGTYVVFCRSCPIISCREKKGVIRVDTYGCHMAYRPCPEAADSAEYVMDYYDDIRGSIPKRIINWASKKVVPDFMKKMHKAFENYEAFLERRGFSFEDYLLQCKERAATLD